MPLYPIFCTQPGPILESEGFFFGKKRVGPSMKDSCMETDCGGMLITKNKMTCGEADALSSTVDLSDFPAFVDSISGPRCYWDPKDGRVFRGELMWAVYSFLATKKAIQGDPKSYNNSMEYRYEKILDRLVAGDVYTVDETSRGYTRRREVLPGANE